DRHRTVIDCQTHAASLVWCSTLDPSAPFAMFESNVRLGCRPISSFSAARAWPVRACRLKSAAHCAKRLPLVGVRQPPTESLPCQRCPRGVHNSCRCKQRQHGICRHSALCSVHDSLLNYVALAPLSPAIGPATNRDDLQLTVYSNSCVVVVS